MTFASAPNVGERLWELINEARPRILVLDLSAVPDIEYTALVMLAGFEEKVREAGTTLWLASLNPEVLKVIERSPLGPILGHERMFFNVQEAVEAYAISVAGEQV